MDLLEQTAKAQFKLEEVCFAGGGGRACYLIQITTGKSAVSGNLSSSANSVRMSRKACIPSKMKRLSIADCCGSVLQ